MTPPTPRSARRERYRLVASLERLLDAPATYLAFVFAGALVVELVLTAQKLEIPAVLVWLQLGIWAFFGIHFLLGVAIAPNRLRYLRRHWLTALSLIVPFLRVVRVLRIVAVVRAANVVRAVAGVNRTATSLRRSFAWNGAGYAAALTVTVALFGSAALLMFEADADDTPIDSYAEALWWSASTLTTVGAAREPVTLGGRLVGLVIMLAGLVLLGYIAGLLGTLLFARRERRSPRR